jgi:hypothetical protein
MSNLLEESEPMVLEMRKKILEDIGQQITHLADRPWEEISSEISNLAWVLEQANSWRAIDKQSAVFLKISSLALAVYRTLSPLFTDKQELLDTLQSTLKAVFFPEGTEAYLLKRFGISPDSPQRAWNQVCANFKKYGEEQFGNAWTYEQGVKDHKRCFVNIRKCGFADFFLGNGASEVLHLLCVLDYVWADALEEYRIRFERPTTLAEGSDACRFQFFRLEIAPMKV